MPFGLPARVRACLFDLDGVLTPTASVHAAAWKSMFDAYLQVRARATGAALTPFDAVADYEQYVDGKPRTDGTRSFLAARGIHLPEGALDDPPDAETIRGLSARKDAIFVHLLHERPVAAFAGSKRYVLAVRAGGRRTAVVSSSRHCRLVLASAGIADLFDAVVDGVAVRQMKLAGKPAPDTYLAAARALDVPPRESAIFEDALAGVEAGRAGAFAYVVGVDRLGQAAKLRHHGADIVVTDLADLLKPA